MGRVDVGKIESRAVAKHAGELSLEYVRRKAFVDFGRVIEDGLVFVDDGAPGVEQDGNQAGRLFQIDNSLKRNAVVRTNPLSGRRFPVESSQ